MLRSHAAGTAADILLPPPSRSPCVARHHAVTSAASQHASDATNNQPTPIQQLTPTHPALQPLLDTLRLLVPPLQFVYQGGQAYESDPAYPDLLQWRDVEVPALLQRVARQLAHLDIQALHSEGKHDQLDWTLFKTVATLARFVPVHTYLDGDHARLVHHHQAAEDQHDGIDAAWVTARSCDMARDVLSSATALSSNHVSPLRLSISLLDLYIRPLFHAASQRGLTDPATGRKRPAAPGSHLLVSPGMGVHEPLDDPPVWKGGSDETLLDLSNGLKEASPPLLAHRDEALGSWNVLSHCISTLRHCAATDTEMAVWQETWHRLIPPLLSLLSDHDTRFRLAGSRLALLLLSSSAVRGSSVPASLLRTTGISTLLDTALEANLRFTTDPLGAELLDCAIAALRRLVLLLTEQEEQEVERLKKKFESLQTLVEEAILHPWSYATSPFSAQSKDVRLVEVTSRWLALLSLDLGVGVRRVVEISIEFLLLGWIGNLSSLTSSVLPLSLIIRTTKTVLSTLKTVLVEANRDGGRIKAVEKKRIAIVTALARFWTRCRRSEEFAREMSMLVQTLKKVDAEIEETFQSVMKVDPSRFEIFF